MNLHVPDDLSLIAGATIQSHRPTCGSRVYTWTTVVDKDDIPDFQVNITDVTTTEPTSSMTTRLHSDAAVVALPYSGSGTTVRPVRDDSAAAAITASAAAPARPFTAGSRPLNTASTNSSITPLAAW